MTTPTKIEHAELALEHLQKAHRALFDASADIGTPDEIESARHLARLAVRELGRFLLEWKRHEAATTPARARKK